MTLDDARRTPEASWHSRISPTAGPLAVQVPPEVFARPMRAWERQVLLNLIVFAALAVIGAAAAANGSRARSRSSRRRRAPSAAATIASPVATSLREVNDVGEALSRASHDRQRAEAAMRESDMRFRAIVDQNTAGISIVDLDGHFRFANPRHCEITGYSVDELRTKTLIDITHPDDRPKNLDLLAAMMTSGTAYTIEKRFIRKDGRVVWVQVSSVAVRDSGGVPQYAIGLVLDIDERKQAEMANAHLAAVVASSADAIESLSLDGTILTWNQAAEKLYGYAAEEAIGQPLDLIVPDERHDEIAAHRSRRCAPATTLVRDRAPPQGRLAGRGRGRRRADPHRRRHRDRHLQGHARHLGAAARRGDAAGARGAVPHPRQFDPAAGVDGQFGRLDRLVQRPLVRIHGHDARADGRRRLAARARSRGAARRGRRAGTSRCAPASRST